MKISDDYYDSIALGYDELYGEEQIQKLNFLLDKIVGLKFKKKNIKIIDMGCGSCVTVPHLVDFFKNKGIKKINYVGIDNSSSLLGLADERFKKIEFDVEFTYKLILSDATKFIEKNSIEKYDIIISLTAIQNFHLETFLELFLSKINLEKQMVLLSVLNRSNSIDYIRNFLIEDFKTSKDSKDDYYYNNVTTWSQ